MSGLSRHIKQLDEELLALGDEAMLLEELDGFIAGLLVCHDLIKRNRPIGAAGIAGHFDGRRQFSQAARSARARRQFQGSSAARLLIL